MENKLDIKQAIIDIIKTNDEQIEALKNTREWYKIQLVKCKTVQDKQLTRTILINIKRYNYDIKILNKLNKEQKKYLKTLNK